MRLLILAACLISGSTFSASASTILLGTSPSGRTAVDSLLNTLADGDQYLVGTFSNVGGISLSSGSIANILANGGWSQFGAAQLISSISTAGGKLKDTITDNSAAANPFNGLNAYIVIFNTTSAATATQIGIFRASAPAEPWVFPINGAPGSTTFNVDDPTVAAIGGVGSVSSSPQRFVLSNVTVPEPSSFVLMASGIVGLLGYRRMRRVA